MTNYQTTSEQREQLLDDGFVLLSEALPPDLLARWQRIAASYEAQALEAHARNDARQGACVVEDPVGPRLIR